MTVLQSSVAVIPHQPPYNASLRVPRGRVIFSLPRGFATREGLAPSEGLALSCHGVQIASRRSQCRPFSLAYFLDRLLLFRFFLNMGDG
ncbi:hypothetical protein HHS34_011540 [Acidithiobacillus montserratensis]|uniref:Uncharacterized protein n=1 Tax=Acidithiobacillus montserratensis TaxID=2729135 RepID=A0ACD5HEZ2_9PROT|nr:hypothetical protein [Acidithiobacillus montserratensis]MBU2748167.1 hypothetical protein [Acidithiobacillus montserratensis]